MVDGLTFEAEGHVYRYKGRVVPSVTQALEQLEVGSFVAAIKEAMRGAPREVQNSAIAEAVERWRAAAEFGTHVHAACHLHNLDELDEESLDPSLVPYLNSYKRFLGETGFVVTASEVLVYHELMRYAGQLDFQGHWRNASWLVDIKSGVVPSTVGAQTAAYLNALPAPDRPKKRACLQLSEAGYRWFEQKELSDFSLFTSALNCYRHIQKHQPRTLDNGTPIREFA